MPVTQLFRLPGARANDPAVDAWFAADDAPLRRLAKSWFDRMCACGADVRVVLHDGQPTACVGDAAFGYVDAFREHVNVGFFHGASLPDPARLLEGTGKRMRHVKLRLGRSNNAPALDALITAAYADIRTRRRDDVP